MIKLNTDFRKADFAIHAAASAPGSCPETHADTVLWNMTESRFIATDGRMLVAIEFPQRWPTQLAGNEIVMMRVAGVKALYTKLHQKDVVYRADINEGSVEFYYRGKRKGKDVDEKFGVATVDGTPLNYHDQLSVDHAEKARSWENINPQSLATIGGILPQDVHVQMHTREGGAVFLHTYDPETYRAYNALLMPAIIRDGHCSEMQTSLATVPQDKRIDALEGMLDAAEPKCKACNDTGKNSQGGDCASCEANKAKKPKAKPKGKAKKPKAKSKAKAKPKAAKPTPAPTPEPTAPIVAPTAAELDEL